VTFFIIVCNFLACTAFWTDGWIDEIRGKGGGRRAACVVTGL